MLRKKQVVAEVEEEEKEEEEDEVEVQGNRFGEDEEYETESEDEKEESEDQVKINKKVEEQKAIWSEGGWKFDLKTIDNPTVQNCILQITVPGER